MLLNIQVIKNPIAITEPITNIEQLNNETIENVKLKQLKNDLDEEIVVSIGFTGSVPKYIHGNNLASCSTKDIETVISNSTDEEVRELSTYVQALATMGNIAPLLGLLGTVTGMIETFQSITLFGTGDPKLMSGGISQALITTQLGLAVAIPLVLFHSLLAGRANRLVEHLGKYSSDIVTGRELD